MQNKHYRAIVVSDIVNDISIFEILANIEIN